MLQAIMHNKIEATQREAFKGSEDTATSSVVAKAYNLSDFSNEKETKEQLKDFTKFAEQNEIPLKQDGGDNSGIKG